MHDVSRDSRASCRRNTYDAHNATNHKFAFKANHRDSTADTRGIMCTADLVIESRSLIWWRLTRIAFCSPSILGCCWPLPPTALRRGCKGRSLKILAASNVGPRFCKNMVSDPPPHPYISETAFSHRFQKVYTYPPQRDEILAHWTKSSENPRKVSNTVTPGKKILGIKVR